MGPGKTHRCCAVWLELEQPTEAVPDPTWMSVYLFFSLLWSAHSSSVYICVSIDPVTLQPFCRNLGSGLNLISFFFFSHCWLGLRVHVHVPFAVLGSKGFQNRIAYLQFYHCITVSLDVQRDLNNLALNACCHIARRGKKLESCFIKQGNFSTNTTIFSNVPPYSICPWNCLGTVSPSSGPFSSTVSSSCRKDSNSLTWFPPSWSLYWKSTILLL